MLHYYVFRLPVMYMVSSCLSAVTERKAQKWNILFNAYVLQPLLPCHKSLFWSKDKQSVKSTNYALIFYIVYTLNVYNTYTECIHNIYSNVYTLYLLNVCTVYIEYICWQGNKYMIFSLIKSYISCEIKHNIRME